MAYQNLAFTEKDPSSGPYEGHGQIPFDARKSTGWAQSATPEESGTSEVSPSQAWSDLVDRIRGNDDRLFVGCIECHLGLLVAPLKFAAKCAACDLDLIEEIGVS